MICDKLGLDVWEIVKMANHHPRVNILQPGPGVGGHCIAVDPWFIVAAAPEQARLIRTAREVNDDRPGRVVDSVVKAAGTTSNPVIACLGLAFKANIDDLRGSPALAITRQVCERLPGATVLAVEPHVSEMPKSLVGVDNLSLVDISTALPKADVVVLLVDPRPVHVHLLRRPRRQAGHRHPWTLALNHVLDKPRSKVGFRRSD